MLFCWHALMPLTESYLSTPLGSGGDPYSSDSFKHQGTLCKPSGKGMLE